MARPHARRSAPAAADCIGNWVSAVTTDRRDAPQGVPHQPSLAPAQAPFGYARQISCTLRTDRMESKSREVAFGSPEHEAVYEGVAQILTKAFPGRVDRVHSVPVLEVRLGGERAVRSFVSVIQSDKHVIVRSTAWVLRGVHSSLELYRLLLLRSGSAKFGAYFINEDGDVGFSHAIVGETLDEGELVASVTAVASTAASDDELGIRFGGIRAEYDVPVV